MSKSFSVQTLSVGYTIQSYAQTILKLLEERIDDLDIQKYAVVIFNNLAAQSKFQSHVFGLNWLNFFFGGKLIASELSQSSSLIIKSLKTHFHNQEVVNFAMITLRNLSSDGGCQWLPILKLIPEYRFAKVNNLQRKSA